MAETDDIFGTTDVGQIAGVESSLSPYAGPYVTDMLGKGAALSDMDLPSLHRTFDSRRV
jgi:hypothetical protein